MMEIIIKDIIENSNKIDNITNKINKTNFKNFVITALIVTDIYFIIKKIKRHETRINIIESRLEDIESKGE